MSIKICPETLKITMESMPEMTFEQHCERVLDIARSRIATNGYIGTGTLKQRATKTKNISTAFVSEVVTEMLEENIIKIENHEWNGRSSARFVSP